MFQNRLDELYMTISKEVGGIEGLLGSFFDFMFRKTDFFYECYPGDNMGFPPGYSRKLLISVYDKFQDEHYKRFPKKDPAEFEKRARKLKEQKEKTSTVAQPLPHNVQASKTPLEQPKSKVQQQQQKPAGSKTQVAPIINTYNGGSNDKYSWSQQSHDVEVVIDLEKGITSKSINVTFKTDYVSIKKKTGEVILEGPLYDKINTGECLWRIEQAGGKTLLTLNMEKAQDKIWSTVFQGDPEIDTSKVNNTKPLHQFDGETQGAIRKIMYEQQRKQMGLPTTEQEKQIEALKKAWDAQGSPFKGQPFDPSKFNLQGGNFVPQ